MVRHKLCENCSQSHNCRQIYERLGQAGHPSVLWAVIEAFLLPGLVFIAALAAAERFLAGVIRVEMLRTIVSFLLALILTLCAVLFLKITHRLFRLYG